MWVTKYRRKVLVGEIAVRVRELVRETCEAFEIRIVKGVVSQDHVHILVSAHHLKTPYPDGTTDVVFEPLDFMARLAALVPTPRVNLTRYHGVNALNI